MNAPATPTSALVIMPRVDPVNCRASQDGPASRSKRMPATTPITRIKRNVTTDIPDNAGIALFRTSTVANFSTATRLDAVGSTAEANTLYKQGTGYPALTPFSIDY